MEWPDRKKALQFIVECVSYKENKVLRTQPKMCMTLGNKNTFTIWTRRKTRRQ